MTQRLRPRLYSLALIDEFGPIYALFTLWFTDNGVTTAQLSVVFVLWAALGVVLEVPSGALADRVDRRALLASAFALRAIGIAAWLVWPSTTGLFVGAVLWAVHDALASGAWEAMIHDQLDAVGAAEKYGVVIARVGQFSNIGLAGGTILATLLIQAGASISAIGWVNVAIHAVSITLVLKLPDVRWVAAAAHAAERADHADPDTAEEANEPTSFGEWWRTLRTGISHARHQPNLFRLSILGSLVGGLFVVDEYVPLLARQRGASDALVPMIVFVVWLGLVLGGELAARKPDLGRQTVASMLFVGSGVIAIAIVIDRVWALLLIGFGYAAAEATWVIGDARFQASAPVATRATVTSVRSLGEGLVAGLAFVAVAAFSSDNDPTVGLYGIVAALAVTSVLVWRWLPSRKPTNSPS